MDTETKQYLEVLFMGLQREITSFKDDLTRLSSEILKQGAAIHSIELGMTQKITKVEGDLNSAFEKIRVLAADLDAEESARVQSAMSFGKRQTDFENAEAVRWAKYVEDQKTQAIENDRNTNARKLLAGIATIVGAEIFYLLWKILLGGGIGNIIP